MRMRVVKFCRNFSSICCSPDFVYQHRWTEMLVLWDNRTVMHSAQGGYSGYRRVMHRTTVAGSVPV